MCQKLNRCPKYSSEQKRQKSLPLGSSHPSWGRLTVSKRSKISTLTDGDKYYGEKSINKGGREWLASGRGATLNRVLGEGFAEVTLEPRYARLDRDRAVRFELFWISHSMWLVNWETVQERKK